MKNVMNVMVPALALALGFSSCDKLPTEPATTTTPTPTNTTPTAPTPVTPTAANDASGILVAVNMEFSYSNQYVPMPVTLNTEIGVANFYSSPGSNTLVDGGSVSVNNNSLKKETNNSYSVTATTGMTPSTLDFSSGNVAWNVSGAGSVPSFNFTMPSGFPKYTGTLPSEITKSQGLEISLGSKVTNADSVIVVIVTIGKTLMKSYVAGTAKATFTASELSDLAVVSDNTAYLEVLPWTYKINTYNGKKIVGINETAVVTAVNIK